MGSINETTQKDRTQSIRIHPQDEIKTNIHDTTRTIN